MHTCAKFHPIWTMLDHFFMKFTVFHPILPRACQKIFKFQLLFYGNVVIQNHTSMCSQFFEYPNWYLLHKRKPIFSLNLNFFKQRSFREKKFPPKNWLKIWGSLLFSFHRPTKQNSRNYLLPPPVNINTRAHPSLNSVPPPKPRSTLLLSPARNQDLARMLLPIGGSWVPRRRHGRNTSKRNRAICCYTYT